MAFFARLCPAANEIVEVAADRHGMLPLPLTFDAAHSFLRGHHLWAAVLGIRSLLTPKRDPARPKNKDLRAFSEKRLGNLDSHITSEAYGSFLWIPAVFPSRATVDATFVPWLRNPVKMMVGRQLFPLLARRTVVFDWRGRCVPRSFPVSTVGEMVSSGELGSDHRRSDYNCSWYHARAVLYLHPTRGHCDDVSLRCAGPGNASADLSTAVCPMLDNAHADLEVPAVEIKGFADVRQMPALMWLSCGRLFRPSF
jgi:hypothetical protein